MSSNSTEREKELRQWERELVAWLEGFQPRPADPAGQGRWDTSRAHTYGPPDLESDGLEPEQRRELARLLRRYAELHRREAERPEQPGDFIYAMM